MKTLLSVNANHHIRGGSDVMYFEHAALFEAHGWTSVFSAMHSPENLPTPYSRFFADEIDPRHGTVFDKALNALKIIYSPQARRRIGLLLDEYPVDVAHVHVVFHHQSPSVLYELKKRGIPTVLTAHDFKMICPDFQMRNSSGICEECKGKKVWNVALNRCMMDSFAVSAVIALESAVHQWLNVYGRHVDKIVVPSRFYREKFIEWGWPAEQLVYIPNFIAIPPPAPPRPVGSYFLYFGRLSPEKGVVTFLKAIARSGLKAKIAGTGPLDADLKNLAHEIGADVEFLGFLKGDDLWDVVDKCRAIVLPSEWYENAPMSAIEANLRGKSIIGARIGGIPELIEHGQTGWLFRSGDVDDLAGQLSAVAAMDDADIADIGAKAKTAAEERHSPERYYEAMCALYRSIGVTIDS